MGGGGREIGFLPLSPSRNPLPPLTDQQHQRVEQRVSKRRRGVDGRADGDRGLALPVPAAPVVGGVALAAAAAAVVAAVAVASTSFLATAPAVADRQRLDRRHHLVGVHRVESRPGLVEEEHARVADERDADVDAPCVFFVFFFKGQLF